MEKILATPIVFWLTISCQTSVQNPQSALKEKLEAKESRKSVNPFQQHPHIHQITAIGENDQPAFSKSGRKILFVSRNRPNHNHSQIYELDLSANLERRVTHHSGDDFSPTYILNDAKILYSSSTDERKENRKLIRQVLRRFEKKSAKLEEEMGTLSPTELYVSDLRGNHIERLTSRDGFDGFPSVHPLTAQIAFSSEGTHGVELLLLDLKNQKMKPLFRVSDRSLQSAFSPDGTQIVWVQSAASQMAVSQLYMAQLKSNPPQQISKKEKWEQITWAPRRHESPSWHPSGDEILFSANLTHREFMNLYVLDLKRRCLKELLASKSNETNASFSSDGKRILFSSDQSGTNQIYLMDYTPPLQCVPEIL